MEEVRIAKKMVLRSKATESEDLCKVSVPVGLCASLFSFGWCFSHDFD